MKLFESGFGLREVKTAGLARAYRLGETPRSVWYTVRSGEFFTDFNRNSSRNSLGASEQN